ncbi:DUF3108 domain-containing protein [Paucibacter soli]|uniref:DUF3108 domain-containing protein n=1 Tax=Paucibacter soli TaxID=3133433 RepID=UPI0030A8CE38
MLREVKDKSARHSIAVALLCALALHAGLWRLLQPALPAWQAGGARLAMQTRALPAVAPPTPVAAPREAVTAARPSATAAAPGAAPIPSPAATEPLPAALALPLQGTGRLSYRYTQGQAEGQALLSWELGEQAYQLRLERELAGRALPAWRSEGRLDAQQGLAPARFAVQRGGRDRQAINFRREQGLISFSASAELQALPEGVQDRLSWWLQLPALLAAQPTRLVAGQELRLPVAALRGTALDWVFRVEGREEDGLWHLSRQALGPYDARLDIWLDPQRRYLPVRVRQSVGEEERWEMRLEGQLDSQAAEPAASDDSPNP